MSGSYAAPIYSFKPLSAGAAFLAHAVFFSVGGFALSQPAEYGVEAGRGGMEVYLAAAPVFVEAPVVPQIVKEDVWTADKDEKTVPPPTARTPEFRGDGSSPVPGNDATTLQSAGGAQTTAKPNYLKNPAPLYPEEARRAGQEGLVVLFARVRSDGLAEEVFIKAGSGYPILDEAALKAVQRWKFKPAKVGSVAVESWVEIPVRFQIEKFSSQDPS